MAAKLEDLISLEKNSDVNLCYCDFIVDNINEKENIRTRILRDDKGKFYFHQMKDGLVEKCFEVAFSWKPFNEFEIYAYTPDNIHVYEIDTRRPEKTEVKQIDHEIIKQGMTCNYKGVTFEYVNENEVKINGKNVKVEYDSEYTIKTLKTKIKADDGAKGLYSFLDNIAEESKINYSVFSYIYDELKEKYC